MEGGRSGLLIVGFVTLNEDAVKAALRQRILEKHDEPLLNTFKKCLPEGTEAELEQVLDLILDTASDAAASRLKSLMFGKLLNEMDDIADEAIVDIGLSNLRRCAVDGNWFMSEPSRRKFCSDVCQQKGR